MATTTGNLRDSASTSDEDAPRELLESLRWPNGCDLPALRGDNPYRLPPKATSKRPAAKGCGSTGCAGAIHRDRWDDFRALAHPDLEMAAGDPPAERIEEVDERASAPDARHHLSGGVVHDAPAARSDEAGADEVDRQSWKLTRPTSAVRVVGVKDGRE
jgi:hypothetical protein